MQPEIRRIRSDEGLKLRSLRLHALADAPMAFGSTLAREKSFQEHVWHERAAGGASGADRVTFIVERDGEWLGLASGIAQDPSSPADPGPFLVGMFVDEAARGQGLGEALVEAVAAWAREREATRLYLWVTSTNTPAVALLLQVRIPAHRQHPTAPALPIGNRVPDGARPGGVSQTQRRSAVGD